MKAVVFIAAVLNFLPATTEAYSVLTHEAIVDASWDNSIQPLLLKKYPGATADELNDARAYVYGGAIMPDMGYYPFGNKTINSEPSPSFVSTFNSPPCAFTIS